MSITKKSESFTKDSQFLNDLQELPEQLVFILGCHRSGTTFLYQSLAEIGDLNYISAYDIIKYDELLYNKKNGLTQSIKKDLHQTLQENGQDRGLDHCLVGADKAEEYGFILPKDKERFLFKPQLIPANLDKFIEMCKKKQFLTQNNKPLLLKNPDDFYSNYLYIHEQFSKAKFIFIHRHPLLVFNSQIRTWRKMVTEKNTYFARMHPIYEQLFQDKNRMLKLQMFLFSEAGLKWFLDKLSQTFDYYLNNLSKLPQSNYYVLRYEDLCQEPKKFFAEIFQFLNVEYQAQDYSDIVKTRKMEILPDIEKAYADAVEKFKVYLEALNYSYYPNN